MKQSSKIIKLKDDKLTFIKAFQVAQEEEVVRVAKEMVYGTTSKPVHRVGQPKSKANPPRVSTLKYTHLRGSWMSHFPKGSRSRCGKKKHASKDYPHIKNVWHYCQFKGYLLLGKYHFFDII